MQTPKPASRTTRNHTIAKCVSLLIGLPLVLHLALAMTRDLGVVPALVLTMVAGVGLSVVYRRPDVRPADEPVDVDAYRLVSA